MTLGTRQDEASRLGAAAAIMVTLAAALTAVTLIRSGTTDNTLSPAASPGTDMPTPRQDTLAAAAAPPAHDALASSPPTRLAIPALDLDTDALIELRRTAAGVMEVPGHSDAVGWLTTTVSPGERGASVLTGHTRFAYERGVFFRLHSLRPGHEITVGRADGTEAVFRVHRVERMPEELALDRATAATGHPDLRLLTTSGEFDRPGDSGGVVLVSARLTAVR